MRISLRWVVTRYVPAVVCGTGLADVEDDGGGLAIEDGLCTFIEARGLLGYSKCSDSSQATRDSRRTTAGFVVS